MKKITLTLTLLLALSSLPAKATDYQTRLYHTIKVWGFVKYYHSEVSACKMDWDSVLLRYLPAVKQASSDTEFNLVLDSLISAAGPMKIASTPKPKELPPRLRPNLNFGWMQDAALSQDIQQRLYTIWENFRPHLSCWAYFADGEGNYTGYIEYPYDSVMLNKSAYTNFPNEQERLLILAKYWNLINYFSPYNSVIDTPIDTILYRFTIPFAEAQDYRQFNIAIEKLTALLDDAHVEDNTFSRHIILPQTGWYAPLIGIRYVEGKYIVVKSLEDGISAGDEILQVDGLPVAEIEDSLRPYFSVGNESVFRNRYVSFTLLAGSYGSQVKLVVKEAFGGSQLLTLTRSSYLSGSWFPTFFYYPVDSIKNISYAKWKCNTAYVNLSKVTASNLNTVYEGIRHSDCVIIDDRYPGSASFALLDKLLPDLRQTATFLIPDLDFPGTFREKPGYAGLEDNPDPSPKKIIVIVNEQTQSSMEYLCMGYQSYNGTTVIGSQTAGADGNVSYLKFTEDIYTKYSSIGVFYPNGDSTQRVGIKLDHEVKPTREGIVEGKDELLEKAIELACLSSLSENEAAGGLQLYPNPAGNELHISTGNTLNAIASISIIDISGREVLNRQAVLNSGRCTLEVQNLPAGLYLLRLQSGSTHYVARFSKK